MLEKGDLTLICQGSRVFDSALAWELVKTFFAARFRGTGRKPRRLAKVAELESKKAGA